MQSTTNIQLFKLHLFLLAKLCAYVLCKSIINKNVAAQLSYLHRQIYQVSFIKAHTNHKRQNRSLTTKEYRKVTHCIFDMDGTITDSEKTHHEILRTIIKEQYNADYTQDMQSEVQGLATKDLCSLVATKLRLPISPDELLKKLKKELSPHLPKSPLQKGVKRLLYHLHRTKIPIAMATNSTMKSVDLHAKERPELFGLFHHKVCVDDPEVSQGKPSPEIYLLAAKRFNDKPKPEDCLAFEDTVAGIRAATGAGMQVVLIPARYIDPEKTKLATIVLKSLLDFKPEIFGLPPFTDQVA